MIFTYLIQYDGIDGFGSVNFCAESKMRQLTFLISDV